MEEVRSNSDVESHEHHQGGMAHHDDLATEDNTYGVKRQIWALWPAVTASHECRRSRFPPDCIKASAELTSRRITPPSVATSTIRSYLQLNLPSLCRDSPLTSSPSGQRDSQQTSHGGHLPCHRPQRIKARRRESRRSRCILTLLRCIQTLLKRILILLRRILRSLTSYRLFHSLEIVAGTIISIRFSGKSQSTSQVSRIIREILRRFCHATHVVRESLELGR